jgi:hypothetical protein
VAVRRLKRPRDPIQLGKPIVDIATGQIEDKEATGKTEAAVARGKKRGPARACGVVGRGLLIGWSANLRC